MTKAPAREASTSSRARWLAAAEVALLALVAYVPFLRSSPGVVSSDSKQALYVDPGRFLLDAASLWDPSVGMGTVPHQHIGYLWPMGPWFWAFEQLGAPDWIAQRLWLGTLTLAAALGARWLVRSLGLGRAAALAAALVYALTPYQLAFTARTSVLLLPWAGLPWLVELARRSVRVGGWRHPALFALVVLTTAGVNAPSLLLVGLAPLAVLVVAALGPTGSVGRSLATAARLAALTLPACAFWLAGLRAQGAYGMPVLQLTENLRTTSEWSSPDDVLRGLGNWFFYGFDRSGPSLDQSQAYLTDPWYRPLSYLVAAAGLAAATVVRWRHRGLTILLLLATVIAVGAWPYDRPSPLGRLLRSVLEGASAGLAFRNSARIVPVVVLGLALALAAALAALDRRARYAGAVAVGLLALASLAPVTERGMLSSGVERPEELPAYWLEAAEHLDAGDASTRVLELPGANFAAYRWGNAIEPITPLLIDRPYLAREVLPYGTPASALLLDALDRRLQNGVLEPESVAPVARLLGVGDIVVRSDLAHERFDLVRPDQVWEVLVDPRAADLGDPATFGEPVPNPGDPVLAPLGPDDLRPGRTTDRSTALPPVAVLAVDDPQPIVRTSSPAAPVLLAGDADGIVDAAAAGVVDGRTPVLLSAALDDDALDDAAAADGARLVVTDGNRRRIQTWFSSLSDTRGPTEEADETIDEPSGNDARLDAFADTGVDLGTDAETVVDQLGAEVRSSSGGGAARPEDRAVAAVDGRPSTAWRVGGADPRGAWWSIELDEPQRLDQLTLVQPQDGPRDRVLTRVRITVDDEAPFEVELGDASLTPEGQVVELPARSVSRVEIELLETSTPPFDPGLANAVGFAEVRLGDLVVEETVRLPVDLLGRLGAGSDGRPLDLVLTRLRTDADRWDRADEEARLDRTFALPGARSFTVTGTARVADEAPDDVVDALYGTDGTASVTSSSRLQGDPTARASRALDGDATTAWTSGFGELGDPWLEVSSPDLALAGELELDLVVDERHARPSEVVAWIDGREAARVPVDGETVRIPLDGIAGSDLRLTFEGRAPEQLPVAVREIRGDGLPQAPAAGTWSTDCRADLVEVDGQPYGIELSPGSELGTFEVTGCEPAALDAGDHRLRTALGEVHGVEVDALRLSDGTPTDRPPTPAPVAQTETSRTEVTTTVESDGTPFWFVLGQSTSPGWTLRVEGAQLGPRTLVDGATDGWLVTPDAPGELQITASWTPQRSIWIGLAISAIALVVALGIVVATDRRAVPAAGGRPRFVGAVDDPGAGIGRVALAAVGAGVLGVAIARPWTGVAMAVGAAATARWPRAAWALAAAAPLTLAASRIATEPELGWLALGWVLAAAVGDAVRRWGQAPP
jgi:arabinofuranan 3-O-arabinosyltransferase